MSVKVKKWGIKKSFGEVFADIIIYFIVTVLVLITLLPFVYIFSMSISDPQAVLKQEVILLPKGFSLAAFKRIFALEGVGRAYLNTFIYLVSITLLSDLACVLVAYPLSLKRLYGRKFWVVYLLIPMFFSGGLIPTFVLMIKLGLYNNMLAIIVPNIVSLWNIILVRTYFRTIPYSLFESAYIDGANDFQTLFRIVVPLAKPILAVVTLYTAVGVWNNWFNARLYLQDESLYPLQYYLAQLLVFKPDGFGGGDTITVIDRGKEQLQALISVTQMKYAMIVFVVAPIVCLYPFLQKYFIKGALIGSLKE